MQNKSFPFSSPFNLLTMKKNAQQKKLLCNFLALVCTASLLFLSACKKEDPKEVAESNNQKYQENYYSTLRIDMDKLDEEYMKLDPVVRKNYQTRQNVLLLLTRKNGNILYAKQKITKNLAARTEGEGASFIGENNPILEEFDNADLKDEEDKPINFFEIDSNKQKQFLKAWTINNGKNLEEKIKLEPTIKDIIIKENQAFEESLQEVKGIAMNSKVAEENRNIDFDLLAEKMNKKINAANQQVTANNGRTNVNSLARTDGNDNQYINFLDEKGDVGMYWSLLPYYQKGRFLLRLKTLTAAWTLLLFGSPGHCSVLKDDYQTFVGKKDYYTSAKYEKEKQFGFTIGAYPKNDDLGTVNGVQNEPFKVWSRAFYVCAPATSSYRWRWCCYIEIMRWKLPQNEKDIAVQTANFHLGKPYGASVSTNGMIPDKYTTWQYYCSKLIFQIYWQVNKNCNLSTWYEDYPSPNSIFRDDECIVLSPELYASSKPRPQEPYKPTSPRNRGNACFIAGTKILMANGTLKNIEDIEIGDEVKTSKGYDNVIQLKPTPQYEGILYSINNSSYFVTESHPFKTTQGWKSFNPSATKKVIANIQISQLQKGDTLIKTNGIEIIRHFAKQFKKIPVYNFEVNNAHEYFANDFLVHNK